ncbi:hypothetical protein DL764_005852 [Monosporascus ibericus]|uniref:Asl1-like glycosyl hydrolase catalytic domain-containing protein n=1 Tax=Monosporascus ibericus TaxID=155417 RepID=A0A4Q4T779_9PEZI|nr:hypothetical protein DL764_005852 [Monosporascus ibericus]
MRPLSRICATALGVCTLGVSADSNSTSKRGISFIPETPPSDYDILLSSDSSPITWYYTWSPRPAPEDHIFPWGARSGIEFVPTLHSIGDGDLERDIERLGSLPDSSKNLFTFNEPDGTTDSGGSAITPREAAEAYIEQIVPLRERFRVSHPSVTGSERGLEWLREFDSACREIDPENGCPTDFVVAHWYGGLEGLTWWLEELVDLYVSGDYGFESEDDLELWIKELGIPGAPAEANQVMMEQTLPYLDGLNYVAKYAWFGTFRPQQANEWTGEGVALFQDDGGLTAIGALYLGGEANGFQVGDQGRDPPQPPEEDDDSNEGDDNEQDDSEGVATRVRTGVLGARFKLVQIGSYFVGNALKRAASNKGKSRVSKAAKISSNGPGPRRSKRWAAVSGSANGDTDYNTTWGDLDRDEDESDEDDEAEPGGSDSESEGKSSPEAGRIGPRCPNKNCFCFISTKENPDHPGSSARYDGLEVIQNLFLGFNEAAECGWRELDNQDLVADSSEAKVSAVS